MKSSGTVILLLVLAGLTQLLAQEPSLIYVQQVFRHGHREPIYSSKADGSSYIDAIRSMGELTKQGKSMHYILGQNLYKFYWNQLFAGTPYVNTYNQSKFYVKSTNVNRTIQSVDSQLLGIFENLEKLTLSDQDIQFSLPQWPNVNRQAGDVYVKSPFYNPVPVHVEKGYMSPWDNGDFLRAYSTEFCPNQDKWMTQNKQNPDVIKIVNDPSFQKAITSLSNVLKTNLTFWDVYKYYDSAVCMNYQGRPIDPIWTNPSATKSALDAIYNLDMYLKLFYQEKQNAVTATGYFNETYHHFKRVTKDQSGVQWAFYSAHDTTVGNFLSRMNMTNANCIYENYLKGITKNSQTDSCVVQYPIYTSNIIFEVYKYKNSTFTFKIRYNGQLRKIPFCDNKLECPVERYYEWFESWRVKDVVRECGIIDEQETKASTYFSIAVIEFGIILCFAIAALYGYLSKKDDQNDKAEQKTKADEKKAKEASHHALRESLIQEQQQE